jgi:hypothetical protein
MYEYGTLKPAEVILRKGRGKWEKMEEEMNKTRVHYMHIWKSHNETPCTTIIC